MVKGDERYVFLFDDESRAETLRLLGRYASNPELSFTWQDAAILSQRIREEAPVSEKRFRDSGSRLEPRLSRPVRHRHRGRGAMRDDG